MATIIAGNFETEAQAKNATARLLEQGVSPEATCLFFVNPPGQHAAYPIGGDHDESSGAVNAERGAVAGASIGGTIGLGIGLAASPLLGPAGVIGGAGAGAYTGALVGALNDMGQHAKEPRPRPAGIIVAVIVNDRVEQALVANALGEFEGRQIEVAEGNWRDGKWADFDPLTVPKLISQPRDLMESRTFR